MAKVTFDGPNSLIIVNAGITELDIKIDIYSDWKEWVLTSDNSKWNPALRVVGGDPISLTRNLGATYFLINGWRIRPDEVSHRLILSGNLFTDPAGFSPVVPTIGSYQVVVEYSTSNLIDGIDGEGMANTVWTRPATAPVVGTYGEALFTLNESMIMASGLVTAGTTSSSVKTNINFGTGYFDGMLFTIVDGTDKINRRIDSYINTNGEFIPDVQLPFTPNIGSQIYVVARHIAQTGRI